jgi:outer membrane protein OmpA-like peptidoglycan-associated protein
MGASTSYALNYYGGFGGGFSSLQSSVATETSKNGFHLLGDFSAELNSRFGNFMATAGLDYVWLSGTTDRFIQTINIVDPLLAFGWSYPVLFRGFEVGLQTRAFIGPGTYGSSSADSSIQWLVSGGPQLQYRYAWNETTDVIFSAAILESFNDSLGTRWDVPLGVKIRLPFERTPATKPLEPPLIAVTPVTPPAVKNVTREGVAEFIPPDTTRIILPSNLVNFEKAKALLSPEGTSYIRSLGKLVSEMDQSFTRVEVEGHTDIRGSSELNRRLSLARAHAVADELAHSGVELAKIKVFGKGSSEPMDPAMTEEAFQKNRRVEIKIFSESNQEEFIRKVNELSGK